MTEAKALIEKYKAGACTPEEMQLIDKWLLTIHEGESSDLNDADFEQIQMKVWQHVKPEGIPAIRLQWWSWDRKIAVAACVLFVFGLAIYFLNIKPNNVETVHYTGTIKPGGNKAYLITSDGRRLSLTDAGTGEIAKEDGVCILKDKDGQLVYKVETAASESKALNKIHNNTLETPRGGQYQVELPDGTKVWLNAASTLKFPSAFPRSAKERVVEMVGEAYFEVSKDKTRPFIVKSNGQEVKVLGTHFNIYSYPQEPTIKTTLLEGLVQVKKGGHQVTLKPGQQSLVTGITIEIQPADTELAMAWKNNKIMFEQENIRGVMAKIARWYDIDVVYEGEMPEDIFGGSVDKSDDITAVLKSLELTGKVHFKIQGRRIFVRK